MLAASPTFFLVALAIILGSLTQRAPAFSGTGSGTENDPFVITNVLELQDMRTSLSAHYVLANDIDAYETADWNDGPYTPDVREGFLGTQIFMDNIRWLFGF